MNIRLVKSGIAAALICLVALSSCNTPRDIAYFQNITPGELIAAGGESSVITIRPKDKLSILVSSQDPRLTNLFNLPIISQQVGVESNYNQNRGLSGYTVDSKGEIDFPVLGKIKVLGMTREKVSATIKGELEAKSLVKDPVVTVEFMNLSFAVMGEVNKPGQYKIDKDDVTLLDALSQAGDLTIYGKRDRVIVMRNENGSKRVYDVNLCDATSLYQSPVYHLQQNDVVYVEPNDTRKRQSTVNGNNVRSTSFWISLASLMTSVAVLIAK